MVSIRFILIVLWVLEKNIFGLLGGVFYKDLPVTCLLGGGCKPPCGLYGVLFCLFETGLAL